MDLFDVLRRGCTFGASKRSKAVVFAKDPRPGEHKQEDRTQGARRKAASTLDFFGYGPAGGTSSSSSAQNDGLANLSPKSSPKVSPQLSPSHATRAAPNGKGRARRCNLACGDASAPSSKRAREDSGAEARRATNGGSLPSTSALRPDEVAALRKRHRIRVSAGAPPPVESFDAMPSRGVPEWLVRNLKGLGFASPTAVQMQCFPAVMAGGHVLASAPTGSGKTIAFLGPILARLGKPGKEFARAVVIDPTRELASQTLGEFVKLTAGRKWSARLLDKLTGEKAKNIKRLDIAIATPLRLAVMLREDRISLDATRHLVLDEADKLFDLGFAPQIDEILTYCPKVQGGPMQTLMFSATLPPAVCDLAGSILTNPLRVCIGDVNAAAPDVEQRLLFITNEDGKLFSFRQLLQEGKLKPPALVFVQSKERAQQLFGELIYDGIFVDAIHADRTKVQRDNTIKAFRAGKIWVLICTDLMARGVDFKGVETVVNYDFPQSASTYIHRIGRTGRAGRSGTAITFFTIQDFDSLRSIVGVMRQSGCEVPEWMLRLKKGDKKKRRVAERRPPTRKRISTTSGWDLKKAYKKRQIVEATKKAKRQRLDGERGSRKSAD